MRIDSHQHFWKYNETTHSWITDAMSTLRNDFLPEDLEPILRKNNMQGCIAVEAHQSETETAFLLNCAKEHPFIKGVVGWVDLRSDRLEERLAYFSKNPLLKGVRHLAQAEGEGFLVGADFMNGISKLKQVNLTYDILIFPHQLKEAIELVSRFPDQAFVLDHLAKPYIKSKNIEAWQKDIESLAQNSNIQCKISGMVTEADWTLWTAEDFAPYLDVVFNCFGAERIMFGSDWPVCKLAAQYEEVLRIVEHYISSFSKEEQQRIMGGNAIKFYNLEV
jgi:L-fuconolactonase